MIDGRKLTFSGETLRTMLGQRIRRHEEKAGHWTRETLRAEDDETEDAPLLPQHMCENEAERHTWRAQVRFAIQGLHLAHVRRCALMQRRASRRLGDNDAWLVATAESLNADIVGADRTAFERLGARYLRFR
jgi:hypothetical protein